MTEQTEWQWDGAIVCTLDGGVDAMRGRLSEWQAAIGPATARESIDGGVALTFGHDADHVVELARLAAAEYACCTFFTFTLTISGQGVRFEVRAPAEARDVVSAVFGVAGPGGPRIDNRPPTRTKVTAGLAALACAACCALPFLIAAGVLTGAGAALLRQTLLAGSAGLVVLALGMWWLHRRTTARRSAAAGAGCSDGNCRC